MSGGESPYLEILVEGHFTEEDPWIIMAAVEVILQLTHRLQDAVQLLVAHQTDQRCFGSIWFWECWTIEIGNGVLTEPFL
jgi:hypothetical protein